MDSRGGEAGREARALVTLGPASSLTDGELLERFEGGDADAGPSAFEALVERHGPMVLRVARGVLGDAHAAEDAFQATFLVLARRARTIRGRDSVASWLHGVALRVAGHARAAEARRRRHERASASRPDSLAEPGDDHGPEIHEALARLPEWLRAPVVLCYLEGHTSEDAARLLGRPVGTIKSRLSRARERLRRRLARLDPSSPLMLIPAGLKPAPARLIARAARVGSGLSAPSPAVASLAEGVIRTMMIAKGKAVGYALLAALGLVAAGSGLAQDPPKAEPPTPARTVPPKPDPRAPRELAVTAGRGIALVYAMDKKGERMSVKAGQDRAGTWKEADLELRWVAVTGILDARGFAEADAKARGINPAGHRPPYKRIEVERQAREPGGDWSVWSEVDIERVYRILDNLPEIAMEKLPEELRPGNFVDPLPFLKVGTWRGVDAESLLRADRRAGPAPDRAGPPTLMIRHLDFTVEPGRTYRYRVRVVVGGVEGAKRGERPGPWSEATAEVAVPAGPVTAPE